MKFIYQNAYIANKNPQSRDEAIEIIKECGGESALELIYLENEFHNLKVALKSHILGENLETIKNFPLLEPHARRTIEELINLPLAQYALAQYAQNPNPAALDNAIDKAYLQERDKILAENPELISPPSPTSGIANLQAFVNANPNIPNPPPSEEFVESLINVIARRTK